jgi:hypothetical protein
VKLFTPLWLNGNLNILQITTTPKHTSLYIIHTKIKERSQNCLQREPALHFTLCLLTSTSTDANRAAIWCILLNHTCSLQSLSKISRPHSVSYHKLFSKTRFTCPYCTHYDTHSTYHCAYFSQTYDTSLQDVISDIFYVTYTHNLLMTTNPWCNNMCSLAGELVFHF